MERPAPKPEISDMAKLLQQLVREPPSRPPEVVNPPVPTALEQMLRSFLDGQRQRQRQPPQQRPTRRDWTGVVCFSCGKAGHTATRCPNLNAPGISVPTTRMADRKDAGRICDDTTAGDNGPLADGKRRLIREGGSASRVSIHARPRYPGGGTVSTVSPRRTIFDDVSLAVEQSGEEPPLVSSGCSTVRTEKASAEDTHRRECPHDVVGLHTHRRTRIDDVSLAVEQSGEEPTLVSSGCSTVRTEKASDGSVFMMLLDYTHIRALCGCQVMVCL